MDTTAQHIAAREDSELVARLVASAEQAHIPEPGAFVRANIGKLISTPIDGDITVTTVHAYASLLRENAVAQLPPNPGSNAEAITDVHLSTAVQAVWTGEAPDAS